MGESSTLHKWDAKKVMEAGGEEARGGGGAAAHTDGAIWAEVK